MKIMVTTIGCEKEYGERKVIADDDQIGEIAIWEMEIASLGELVKLSKDVDHIEVEESNWDKYDGHLTFVCSDLSV